MGCVFSRSVKEEPLIERCGYIMMSVLLKCRHKGAFEAAGVALASFVRHTSENGSKVHQMLLEHIMRTLTNRGKDAPPLSRRSAGLAVAVHRIVTSDTDIEKRIVSECPRIPSLEVPATDSRTLSSALQLSSVLAELIENGKGSVPQLAALGLCCVLPATLGVTKTAAIYSSCLFAHDNGKGFLFSLLQTIEATVTQLDSSTAFCEWQASSAFHFRCDSVCLYVTGNKKPPFNCENPYIMASKYQRILETYWSKYCEMCSEEQKANFPLTNENLLLCAMYELPWRSKRKLQMLAELLPRCGEKQVLKDFSELPKGIVQSLAYNELQSAGADVYKALLKSLSAKEFSHYFTHLHVLCLKNENTIQGLANYWLPALIKQFPTIVSALEQKVKGDLMAEIVLLQVQRREGLISFQTMLDTPDYYHTLCKGLTTYNLDIRTRAFDALCTGMLRCSSSLPAETMDKILKLAHVVKKGPPDIDLLKTEKSKPSASFLRWLYHFLVHNLEPGNNYQRHIASLRVYAAVLQEFTDKTITARIPVAKLIKALEKCECWHFHSLNGAKAILRCVISPTDDSLLHRVVHQLLRELQIEETSADVERKEAFTDTLTARLMHVLYTLVSDAATRQHVARHLENIALASLRRLESPNWGIRVGAGLLEDLEISQPRLLEHLTSELRRAAEELIQSPKIMRNYTSLEFHLGLLVRLTPGPPILRTCSQTAIMNELCSYCWVLLSSPAWAVREQSAACILTLTSIPDLPHLLCRAQNELPNAPENRRHGCLLLIAKAEKKIYSFLYGMPKDLGLNECHTSTITLNKAQIKPPGSYVCHQLIKFKDIKKGEFFRILRELSKYPCSKHVAKMLWTADLAENVVLTHKGISAGEILDKCLEAESLFYVQERVLSTICVMINNNELIDELLDIQLILYETLDNILISMTCSRHKLILVLKVLVAIKRKLTERYVKDNMLEFHVSSAKNNELESANRIKQWIHVIGETLWVQPLISLLEENLYGDEFELYAFELLGLYALELTAARYMQECVDVLTPLTELMQLNLQEDLPDRTSVGRALAATSLVTWNLHSLCPKVCGLYLARENIVSPFSHGSGEMDLENLDFIAVGFKYLDYYRNHLISKEPKLAAIMPDYHLQLPGSTPQEFKEYIKELVNSIATFRKQATGSLQWLPLEMNLAIRRLSLKLWIHLDTLQKNGIDLSLINLDGKSGQERVYHLRRHLNTRNQLDNPDFNESM
ncbi:hypothetical protein B566_EDAN011451 [Ephemera danica]|nr:hypothetical protein B566_EDAN011451 [Ephemera danica]